MKNKNNKLMLKMCMVSRTELVQKITVSFWAGRHVKVLELISSISGWRQSRGLWLPSDIAPACILQGVAVATQPLLRSNILLSKPQCSAQLQKKILLAKGLHLFFWIRSHSSYLLKLWSAVLSERKWKKRETGLLVLPGTAVQVA